MTTQVGPPWTSDRYYEIDHCLVKRHWRNSILDIQSDPYTNVNTDHYMIKITIRQALKAKEIAFADPTLKCITLPEGNEEQALLDFNEQVASITQETTNETHQETNLKDLCAAMEQAARKNLQLKPPKSRRKDCHPEIKILIDQRLQALQANDYDSVKDITKLIRRTARKIRVNQQITSLKDFAWEPVKYIKKNFVPRHTKLRDRLGNLVPDNKRAATQADYYEKVQWKPNESDEYKNIVMNAQPIFEEADSMNTSHITMEELNFAISRLKNNKAPGPDGLPSELFKWLNEESRNELLKHLNDCWDTETLEDCMNDANLATIYKKGPTDRPENYRPIALLTSLTKSLPLSFMSDSVNHLTTKLTQLSLDSVRRKALPNPYSSTDAYKNYRKNPVPDSILFFLTGKKLSIKSTRAE